jgi:hypothetical protein
MKRITATLTGDYTWFKKEFDCTEAILKLSLSQLRKLKDHDYLTDALAPEDIVEEASLAFEKVWGKGSRDMKFGFEVEVEESILAYFGVEKMEDIPTNSIRLINELAKGD